MPRRRKRRYVTAATEWRNRQVQNFRRIGTPWPDIAARFGLKVSTVKRICWRVRPIVPMAKSTRPPGRRRLARLAAQQRRLERERLAARARLLRSHGYSFREIASRLGVHRNTAWRWAHDTPVCRLEGRAWLNSGGKPAEWVEAIRARWAPYAHLSRPEMGVLF